MSTYDDRAEYMRKYRKRKIGKLHTKKDLAKAHFLKDPSEENQKALQNILTDIAIHNTERKVCHLGSVKYCAQ